LAICFSSTIKTKKGEIIKEKNHFAGRKAVKQGRCADGIALFSIIIAIGGIFTNKKMDLEEVYD